MGDRIGTILTRIGLTRNNYRVTPGLYAVGSPGPGAPVLVTANYKLSFDVLRFALDGIDAWLLVADTRGINVWCAAGKGTFSTEEVVYSVQQSRLQEVVSDCTLILPQLGATGVAAHQVQKECGFKVLFGPVQAQDLPSFLQNNGEASDAMRSVTFTMRERVVLIPVELYLFLWPLAIIAFAAFLLSGIGPTFFSLSMAWQRGLSIAYATLFGIGCGAILAPLLLPWLPGRQFWIKGLWPAMAVGAVLWFTTFGEMKYYDGAALFFWLSAVSSYLAMNFTGCTPYTSPTGVEYEMRRGLPIQVLATIIALLLWLVGPFTASY